MTLIAYDLIGGAWNWAGDGTLTYLPATELEKFADPLNTVNLSGDSGLIEENSTTNKWGVYLPEKYDLTHYAHVTGGNDYGTTPRKILTSVDTTDGQDGTWVQQGGDTDQVSTFGVVEKTALSVSGIQGVRIERQGHNTARNYHRMFLLWGTRSTTSSTDVAAVWDASSDVPVTDGFFEQSLWPSAVGSKTFRIKNLSASLQANNVTLSSDVLTDASQSLLPEIEFSDGGAYATSLNIGNLTAGSISSTITYRVTKNASATLGVWYPRLVVDVGSWT